MNEVWQIFEQLILRFNTNGRIMEKGPSTARRGTARGRGTAHAGTGAGAALPRPDWAARPGEAEGPPAPG